MTPTIYYCYDAYCGWCYGFSQVMQKIAEEYKDRIFFETLSGGMIPKESAQHIGKMAGYIKGAYKNVEDMTGIKFGEDYLWHINNPEQSDWFPHSEKAAIAMAVFKDYHPGMIPWLLQQTSRNHYTSKAGILRTMKHIGIYWKSMISRQMSSIKNWIPKRIKKRPITNSP